MNMVKLGRFVKASTRKNKGLVCTDVYSVTNSVGFISSTDYFSKEVFSKELSNYKLVRPGMIAYNPSRINVGSVAVQDKCDQAIVSPLYVVFEVDELVKSRFVEMFEHGQDWELRPLAECCATPDDIKCGPFGSQLHKEDYISEGVPVWGIPEVNSCFERMPDKFVSPENGQRLQSYSLVPGDVAMNRKGNVGQAALFDGSKPSGIIHSDVLRVRVSQGVLDPAFLVEQLHSSHVVREQVMSASTGAIMAGTNVTKLKRIKVFVPPLALQQKFSAFVRQVDKLKADTQLAIDKLQMLYDSLAQEYFSIE